MHQKAQIRNSLNSTLVTKNRNHIIDFVTSRLTKVKLLKNIQFFTISDPNRKKPYHPLNLAFLAITAINFHSGGCGFTITTFCFKRYSPMKIWKNPNDIACFFTFFTRMDLIWPKFCPKTMPTLIFFYWFPKKYVLSFKGIQLILKTLIRIQWFWKFFC